MATSNGINFDNMHIHSDQQLMHHIAQVHWNKLVKEQLDNN